jgi:hypothetical protein
VFTVAEDRASVEVIEGVETAVAIDAATGRAGTIRPGLRLTCVQAARRLVDVVVEVHAAID